MGFEGISGAAHFLGQAIEGLAGGAEQVGDAVSQQIHIAQGKTHIPLNFHNGSTHVVSFAVRFQTGPAAEEFPTQNWLTTGWYRINPGQQISVGNTYANGFFFFGFANDPSNAKWEGPYHFDFTVDDVLQQANFAWVNMGDNWLDLSEWTQSFVD
jgi:hypothetical protein